MEKLVSVAEAAEKLGGISIWTVRAWLSQGRLERTKVGNRTMIKESELEKVIQHGGKSPSRTRRSERASEPVSQSD
jgi:excisionase family DNA binding protein